MIINGINDKEFHAALRQGDTATARRGAGMDIPGEAGRIFRNHPPVAERVRMVASAVWGTCGNCGNPRPYPADPTNTTREELECPACGDY